jgi:hypothetical protein
MAYRVADACDHAERQAQPEIDRSDSLGRRSRAAAKAAPRVFRQRVLVLSNQRWRF